MAVQTVAGCIWSSASGAPSITITEGASGNGPGRVAFTIAANSGTARQASLTVAGQAVAVTQTDGCAYGISPSSQSVAAAGSTGTVSVTTSAGCPWTASSGASSITITAGGSGSGPGQVGYAVAANQGLARQGSLTIAGRTFSVSQESGCSCRHLATECIRAGDGEHRFGVGHDGRRLSVDRVERRTLDHDHRRWQQQWPWAGRLFDWRELGTCPSIIADRCRPHVRHLAGERLYLQRVADQRRRSGDRRLRGADSDDGARMSVERHGRRRVGDVPIAQQRRAWWRAIRRRIELRAAANRHRDNRRPAVHCASGVPVHVCARAALRELRRQRRRRRHPRHRDGSYPLHVDRLSTVPWVTVTNGASGSGGGLVQFTVAPAAGANSSGIILIGGQTFTVNQSR